MMEAFGADVIVEKSFGKWITPELIQRMKKKHHLSHRKKILFMRIDLAHQM